jgi:hypothetical protein
MERRYTAQRSTGPYAGEPLVRSSSGSTNTIPPALPLVGVQADSARRGLRYQRPRRIPGARGIPDSHSFAHRDCCVIFVGLRERAHLGGHQRRCAEALPRPHGTSRGWSRDLHPQSASKASSTFGCSNPHARMFPCSLAPSSMPQSTGGVALRHAALLDSLDCLLSEAFGISFRASVMLSDQRHSKPVM